MDNYDVIKKLIGAIDPIGETTADNKRYENLKATLELTGKLLEDINNVAQDNKDRVEYSMSRAGKLADKFLRELGYGN